MGTRREITKKYVRDYAKEGKKGKGVILDELVAVTGWSRANARRALSTARKRKGPAKAAARKPRPRTYGYNTLKVLIEVWRLAGMPSGKYLAATMDLILTYPLAGWVGAVAGLGWAALALTIIAMIGSAGAFLSWPRHTDLVMQEPGGEGAEH